MNRPVFRLTLLGTSLAALMISTIVFYDGTAATPMRATIFIGLLASGVVLYFAAVRLVLQSPLPASALWLVLGLATLPRLVFLPYPPLLSSDIYRYVWDGQVQAAGINPYRYIPVDPALAHLRDAEVYPKINRADYARTIYPPAAQIVFAAMGQVTTSVTGMKAAMLGFEAVAILCLLRLLTLVGLPRERILIYLWNPLPLWSFACDGHVDAIAVGFVALALLARVRRRNGWAGALLALATLAKFMPIVVAPAFARGGGVWRPAAIGAGLAGALYFLYASAGEHVMGFLGAYGSEEGYDTGAGYWLLAGLSRLVALPSFAGRAYGLCVVVAFLALSLWVVRGRRNDRAVDGIALCRDAAVLAAFATAAANPHYAWYYPWLALPCVVAPLPAVIWLSSAPVLLYADPFHERFLWPSLVFVPAIALAAWSVWRHRSIHRRVVLVA